MRLYVHNLNTKKKIYLTRVAANRKQLAEQLGAVNFSLDSVTYSVLDVFAEKASDNTAGGMAAGGVLGVVGGVPGVILGGLLGALLGNNSDKQEESRVNAFNRSTL